MYEARIFHVLSSMETSTFSARNLIVVDLVSHGHVVGAVAELGQLAERVHGEGGHVS